MRTLLGDYKGATALQDEGESGMGIVIVFQDSLTRQWATEVCERTSEVFCHEGIGLRFWRMDDLVHPLIAEEAIISAARAAIIMVAIRDSLAPPPTLCVWNEGWLAQRKESTGLLVSMVGVHPQSLSRKPFVSDYLRAIAMRGGLDYLPRERALPPDAVSDFDLQSVSHRAHATTEVMGKILRQRGQGAGYQHWGINE